MEPHPRICGWTRPKDWRSWAVRRASICCASSPRRARRSCGSSARICSPRCKRMLVDAHAHLDAYSDRAEVVARAKAAGLVHVVAVGQWREGAGMAGGQGAIALAKGGRFFFFPPPGLHPHDAPRAPQGDFMEFRRVWRGSARWAGGGVGAGGGAAPGGRARGGGGLPLPGACPPGGKAKEPRVCSPPRRGACPPARPAGGRACESHHGKRPPRLAPPRKIALNLAVTAHVEGPRSRKDHHP